jgi:hypothetical protein
MVGLSGSEFGVVVRAFMGLSGLEISAVAHPFSEGEVPSGLGIAELVVSEVRQFPLDLAGHEPLVGQIGQHLWGRGPTIGN